MTSVSRQTLTAGGCGSQRAAGANTRFVQEAVLALQCTQGQPWGIFE